MGHETVTERVVETRTIDQTARALASGSSRRAVVRGLAAGLFATAGGGIATSAVNAKNKKKKKKKAKNQSKTPTPNPNPTPNPTPTPPAPPAPVFCPQGTSIAYLSVPSDGSRVFTPVLRKGQAYILRASGYWSTNGDYMNDAFAAFLWKDQRSPVMYHNGVRLGLAVNGESPDLWGSYNRSHTYNLVVIGKGEPVSLQMLDSVYSDNGRLLNLEVLCAAPI